VSRTLLKFVVAVFVALVAPAPGGAMAQDVGPTTTARIVPAAIVDGAVLVRVTIAGHPAYMQVDTGATSSIIDARAARAFGLQPKGAPVTSQEIGCTSRSRTVDVSDWTVGTLRLPALTLTAPRTLGKVLTYRGLPVVGLLGNDALAGFGTVAVDFLDKRLVLGGRFAGTGRTLQSGALTDETTGQVVLFTIKLALSGHPLVFGVDTGAAVSTIEARVARRLHLKRAPKAIKVAGVTCAAKVRPVLVRGWRSGTVELVPDVALARDTGLRKIGLSGLLGASVLSAYGQVTFDYVGKQVSVGYPAPEGAELAAAPAPAAPAR
jgi:predicted aspartyl protease